MRRGFKKKKWNRLNESKESNNDQRPISRQNLKCAYRKRRIASTKKLCYRYSMIYSPVTDFIRPSGCINIEKKNSSSSGTITNNASSYDQNIAQILHRKFVSIHNQIFIAKKFACNFHNTIILQNVSNHWKISTSELLWNFEPFIVTVFSYCIIGKDVQDLEYKRVQDSCKPEFRLSDLFAHSSDHFL